MHKNNRLDFDATSVTKLQWVSYIFQRFSIDGRQTRPSRLAPAAALSRSGPAT
jgi:hypothetical protein